jgi:hypothetical protein
MKFIVEASLRFAYQVEATDEAGVRRNLIVQFSSESGCRAATMDGPLWCVLVRLASSCYSHNCPVVSLSHKYPIVSLQSRRAARSLRQNSNRARYGRLAAVTRWGPPRYRCPALRFF